MPDVVFLLATLLTIILTLYLHCLGPKSMIFPYPIYDQNGWKTMAFGAAPNNPYNGVPTPLPRV